ncbi:hypothetical protein [Lysobacter gummosus]
MRKHRAFCFQADKTSRIFAGSFIPFCGRGFSPDAFRSDESNPLER